MPRITRDLQFRVIVTACALAEEREWVALADVAAMFGITVDVVRAVLEPVLYPEWRDSFGELRGYARAFFLDEDDVLNLDNDGAWLRDLDSRHPEPADALRLLLAGMYAQAALRSTDKDLDAAVVKLRSLVDAAVVIAFDPPPLLATCQQALEDKRRLRVRYRPEYSGAVKDHVLEPSTIASKWANWYLLARADGNDAIRTYRIDRIIEAEITDEPYDRGEPAELPEWFQLDEFERTIRCRASGDELKRIPRPATIREVATLDDGRIEAEVTVIGATRYDTALLVLGPDVEVLGPPEAVERRRSLAAEILTRYRG